MIVSFLPSMYPSWNLYTLHRIQ